MQEHDAQRRLAILRGEEPLPLPPAPASDEAQSESRDRAPPPAGGRDRKRRKRAGEDDTDFELRAAREQAAQAHDAREESPKRLKTSDAPITDKEGHIDLFGEKYKQPERARRDEKVETDAEKKKKRKEKELEDQVTMRFSNAAGKGGLEGPWYSKAVAGSTELVHAKSSSTDIWGNDDPGRQKRNSDRITASDPLAMMRQGAAKVREVKKERQKFQEERQEEMRQMRKEERREERKRERHDRERRGADHRHRDGRRHKTDDDSQGREAESRRLSRNRDREEGHHKRASSPKRSSGRDGYSRDRGSQGHYKFSSKDRDGDRQERERRRYD